MKAICITWTSISMMESIVEVQDDFDVDDQDAVSALIERKDVQARATQMDETIDGVSAYLEE